MSDEDDRRKVGPRAAARVLGVHPNTMYAWCRAAAAGEETPLGGVGVERNPLTGRYALDAGELASAVKDAEDEKNA